MRRILKPLKGLIARCKKRGVRVVWIRSVRRPGDNERDGHGIRPGWVFFRGKTDWMGGPAEGSWGAEFAEEVKPGPRDIIVRKKRHSAFYKSDLERVLRRLGVDTLLFTGIATYACVEASLRDAYFRDFDVVLVEDCCAASNLPMHKATLRLVRNLYGAVAPSRVVAAKLKPR
jgi:ureidoacrylate peracid hydrolase